MLAFASPARHLRSNSRPERFRTALLRVFQQPQRVRGTGGEEEAAGESSDEADESQEPEAESVDCSASRCSNSGLVG